MHRTLLPALLAFSLLAGTPPAQERHIHTDRSGARILPLPQEKDTFYFLIFGDRTGGPPEGIQVLRQAVKDANLLGPDLVMTVGDLVQGYNATPEWLKQAKEFKSVMDRLDVPWFPVVGNHDVYWRGKGRPEGEHEADFEKHFGPLYYYFTHKNAAFLCLYSDENDPETGRKGYGSKVPAGFNRFSDHQLAWLKKSLREVRKLDHVFLFMHHPRWDTSYYRGSNWDKVHELLKQAGNVSAVFAGHIHRMRYDGKRDGIEYFTLATTGGHVGDWPQCGQLHHMNLVTVRPDGYKVATIPVGQVMDPRLFTPDYITDLGRLRGWRPQVLTAPVELGEEGDLAGVLALRLDNPSRRPIEVTTGLLGGDAGWRYGPDHTHLVIEPGKSRLVRFNLRRRAGGGLFSLVLPRLTFQVDYLGRAARISLRERREPLAVDFAGLPPHRREGCPGWALDLDGKKDCLAVDSSLLEVPDGPLTLEGWARIRDHKGRRAFLTKTQGSEYGIFVNDGKPDFSVHLDGKYISARAKQPVLQTNRWHHIAGVYDGREVRLYVDGRLVTTKAGKGRRKRNGHPFYIGADPDGGGRPMSFFDGLIDEVRLSTVARYEGERFDPPRRHARDDGTALLLHMDRSFGACHPDLSGRCANARAQDGARLVELETPILPNPAASRKPR